LPARGLLWHDLFMNIFERIANEQIEEAMRRGDFDNLPGKGQPIDLFDDDHIPPDMRLAYRIMKNAGVAPPEVSLRKEIEKMRLELTKARNDDERKAIQREVQMLSLRLALLTKEAKR
jgi:hypothetical protein